jgi:hypothetical protein
MGGHDPDLLGCDRGARLARVWRRDVSTLVAEAHRRPPLVHARSPRQLPAVARVHRALADPVGAKRPGALAVVRSHQPVLRGGVLARAAAGCNAGLAGGAQRGSLGNVVRGEPPLDLGCPLSRAARLDGGSCPGRSRRRLGHGIPSQREPLVFGRRSHMHESLWPECPSTVEPILAFEPLTQRRGSDVGLWAANRGTLQEGIIVVALRTGGGCLIAANAAIADGRPTRRL